MPRRSLAIIFAVFLSFCTSPGLLSASLKVQGINKLSRTDRERASRLFKDFEKYPNNHSKRTEIIKKMMDLGRPVAQKMFDIIDPQLREKWAEYQETFVVTARKAGAKKTSVSARKEVAFLEIQVQSLRALGDGLSKASITKIGDPALKRLRELKVMKGDEIFAIEPLLNKKRQEILTIAQQRTLCIKRLVLLENEAQTFGVKEVAEYEELASALSLGPQREHLLILNQNAKLSKTVLPAEAAAIRDMNQYRILIGLRPCLLDPRLCVAAREHSKDMVKKNFFSHTSPVVGKGSPWVRAKLLGTTANAENIYVGNKNGSAANRAWWISPGHHVNMLSPGARRVGMGVHGKKWTQMLGP